MNEYGSTDPWDELPTPKGDLLTYIKRGVLWVEKKPYYIVEHVQEPDLTYVMVYNVHPGTEKNPQKLAKEIKGKKNTFNTTTRLGQIANALAPAKEIKKWEPKPPLFTAPVVPSHVATLTGKREAGFFEREPDRMIAQGGEKKFVRGRNTGVFIGLSSIEFEDKLRIPTESLVNTLTKYKDDLFYDLEGDNDDDKNPLSRFYKE
jgi:hypothetical protein